MKEKLFQVQQKRELEQQIKSLKLQEQIENVEKRLEQRKIERQQKKILPSIKDMFVEKKAKQELENALKKYDIYPKQDESQLNNSQSGENNIRTQDIESLFFNLTAPQVQPESMAEKVLQKMKQQIPLKKITKEMQKQQANPFYNKQNWEKFMEAERNGDKNIRFPGIGIERTPLYEIQQQEIERTQKKEDEQQKMKRYYLKPTKQKNINFDSIVNIFSDDYIIFIIDVILTYFLNLKYNRVKQITSSAMSLLKQNPSDSLLGHMMERSVHDARKIWGSTFLKSKSQNDLVEKLQEINQLFSIEEDSINSGRVQNSDLTRAKIHSFSKINSSNPNQSILRQQQEETQMQSILNQQAENSLSLPGDDQNESINTRREKVFKENILMSEQKI